MHKLPLRKIPFLGLLLLVVSAVTSFIFPFKTKANSGSAAWLNGTLTDSETPQDGLGITTCEPRNSFQAYNCHITVYSGTTGSFTVETSEGTAD